MDGADNDNDFEDGDNGDDFEDDDYGDGKDAFEDMHSTLNDCHESTVSKDSFRNPSLRDATYTGALHAPGLLLFAGKRQMSGERSFLVEASASCTRMNWT